MINNNKYLYLKQYINYKKKEGERNNSFYPVLNEEIIKAEKDLGFELPSMLKEFWQEIGYGFLHTSHDGQQVDLNAIFHPSTIADAMLHYPNEIIFHPEILDCFEEGFFKEGDIIFFEIGDSADFLYMKAKSDNPNAVYNLLGEMVESSFERFIFRLYYESPGFYHYI